MSDQQAMSRDELVAAIEAGWDALSAFLATLNEDQITQPRDAGGWTVKDHLAHLATWEDSLNALLTRTPRREYMGIPADIWEARDINRINAFIQQRNRDLPLRDLQAMHFGIHGRLMDRLATITDEELARPFNHYQPGSSQTAPVMDWVKGDTFEHYAAHIPWMDAIAKSYTPTVAGLIARIDKGFNEFQTYLATLTPEQITEPRDAAGWTVKDHVAHLACWEDSMNALFNRQPRHLFLGIPADMLANGRYTAINEIVRAPYHDKSYPEVQDYFRGAHARLIARIAGMTDADLLRPYNHYDPTNSRTDPILNPIIGNTYHHYAEHQPWIDAIATRQPITLDAILAPIQSGWDELQAFLSALTYEQVTIPTDAAGWTVKDHLTHLAVWEDSINAMFDGVLRHEHMGVPKALWDANDWDAINEIIRQRYIDMPLRDVAGMFFGIHGKLIDKLKGMTVEELYRPYNVYQPGSSWDVPAVTWVRLDTFEHYAEHTLWMDRIARKYVTSVPNLLASIKAGWDTLNAYLDSITDDQRTKRTDAGGWTVKDHVIHLAIWEDTLNALLEGEDAPTSMSVDQETWDNDHPHGVNATIHKRYRDLSWADVQEKRDEIHNRLLAMVGTLKDADLKRPHSDFQPGSTSAEPLLSFFAGNTFGHYAEHLPWIRAIAEAPPDDEPTTVADVLARIGQGWDEFNAYLATLTEKQLIEPKDAGGWTIKDHVIHLAIWEDGIYALLERLMRVQYMGIDERTWENGDADEINAILQPRYKDLSWAEVHTRRLHIHQRLIDKIASLKDEDLLRPYRFYELASMEDRPVILWIRGNTYEHYVEHLPWIQKIAAPPAPTTFTKAETLASMRQAWTSLNAYLDTLSEDQLTAKTDAGGWSVKDHVDHLAVWEGSMNDFFEKKPRWEALGVDLPTWEGGEIDRINDVIFRRGKALTWDQVKTKFAQAHDALVRRVEAMSEEDLQRPYNHYQQWSQATDTAAHRLSIATYGHYAKHLPWIKAIAES